DEATKDPAKPILVSTDADYMIWCGADALIYAYTERDITRYVETEIYWYDVHTGRKVLVGKESDDYYDMVPLEAPPREEIDEGQE
ncbi:MAG: hypothetical protein GWN86_22650, partial [Desulfobacterales bacterium]|nr:hypothetical protein [Desulfobacterales bacterium]